MPPKKTPPPSVTQNISGDNNVVIAGNENTVNQTIIQKFFNIFKSDAETVDQRNRRIMLGHVENFWVKGILEKSLHGVALVDLGIKEDPDALNYPWAIKREANKETLPAGTSMLEIFEEIGMGRSLLILGAPGSGKTTMLLELTRQLIERAREDVSEPIPVVFNLSSWTEKLTLADWLARELNIVYTIPKKIAPTWVVENKMLLLLDGLDEVKQESRDKCVDAINQFRTEYGLTSMAVCSRIQDYAELKTRLSFDGAIEIQPLTSDQVDEYFKRFGKEMMGIRQVLETDTVLREMAENPLFLSIMTLAYRDTQSKDILVPENLNIQRKHLFDSYVERMFERPERSKNAIFKKQDVLHWLSWLAQKMIEHNQVAYLLEDMQPSWLYKDNQLRRYKLIIRLIFRLSVVPSVWLSFGLVALIFIMSAKLIVGLIVGLVGLIFALIFWLWGNEFSDNVSLDSNWRVARNFLIIVVVTGLIIGLISSMVNIVLSVILSITLIVFLFIGLLIWLIITIDVKEVHQITYPGQRLVFTTNNFLFIFLFFGLIFGLIFELIFGLIGGLASGLIGGLVGGLSVGFVFGSFHNGLDIIRHYTLRLTLAYYKILPLKLTPFLDHCVDLIFLRRVGGGYIFVHRLLMEHFAAMYPEET